MIDFRKPKVLKGLVAQCGRDAPSRLSRSGPPVAHLFEQNTQLGCIIQGHCRIMMDWTTGQRAHL
jgi:hypothetical protein